MGCGCGASRVTTPSFTTNTVRLVSTPVENCDYTMEQFQAWLDKLICCKDKGLYVQLGINSQTMNRYLGIVMSAINYPSNPCYFQNDMGPISNFIILITNNGQC